MKQIRSATSADLAGLWRVEQQVFTDQAWSREALDSQLCRSGGLALVMGTEGQVVASALGWAAGGASELLRIAVCPRWRRRGLGRRMLDAFVLSCRSASADAMWLEVRADNHAAIALYRAAGLLVSGRRAAYYRDGGDALLMELAL